MYHSTIAQRERAQYFDSFVGCALETIANPEVSKTLGWMGLEQINAMLEGAVLPNIRGGKLQVPKPQVNEDTVVILPLDHAHLRTPEAQLTQSEESKRFAASYPRSMKYSSRYGHTFTCKPVEDEPGDRLITDDAWAITYTMWNLNKKSVFERTRPWIIIHPELFKHPTPFIGALALHELVHCQDNIEDGPLMLGRRYIASSELRAYHAASVVLTAYGLEDSYQAVELSRLDDINNTAPFVPSPDLLRWMKSEKLVA